jgi:glycosyltransferase involved in cell wall biosynthesis
MPAIEHLRQKGVKIIWSVDDNIHALPRESPAFHIYNEAKPVFAYLQEHAHDIIVSTEPLKRAMWRGTVLPNLIDTRYWPPFEKSINDPLRILWMGSQAHNELDMIELRDVVERLWDKYDDIMFLFFGNMPEDMGERVGNQLVPLAIYENRIGYVPGVPIEEYPSTMVALNADIGLAPLANTIFNESKSNLKMLEYSMCETPTVASEMDPYCHDDIAMRGDMFDNCCQLIEDSELRLALGQRAKNKVCVEWNWGGLKRELWLNFFRGLL